MDGFGWRSSRRGGGREIEREWRLPWLARLPPDPNQLSNQPPDRPLPSTTKHQPPRPSKQPQGYHKTDRLGRPVYIQLLGRIDIGALKRITTEERMVKFHIQEYERCGRFIFPVCSRLAGRQVDQTFGIMDVKGVGLSHLTGEVKRLVSLLTKYDQDNYPEMLGRICIINAPMVFKAVWALIKPMLNPRTLNKIQICGTDYASELLEWVDADNLPVWLGGRSKGTLLDDAGPWSDPEVLRRLAPSLPAAARALKALRASAAGGGGALVTAGSLGGGGFGGGGGGVVSIGGGGGDDEEEDGGGGGGFASPRSEASFATALSSSGSLPNPEALLGGFPSLTRRSLEGAAGARKSGGGGAGGAGASPRALRSLAGADAGCASSDESGLIGAVMPGPRGSAGGGGGGAGAGAGGRGAGSSLVARVEALEELYAQQVQRLKGYLPSGAYQRASGGGAGGGGSGAAGVRAGLLAGAAPDGSLLQRVDALEAALELLLRAQDLSWQEEEARRARRARGCCGGCTIS